MKERRQKSGQIIKLFEELGGAVSLYRLAQEAIKRGIWSLDEMGELAFTQIEQFCAKTLKSAKDAKSGLTYARPTGQRDDDDHQIWKQRLLWEIPDAEANMAELLKQFGDDYAVIVDEQTYARKRWGIELEVPYLAEPWWKCDDDTEDAA